METSYDSPKCACPDSVISIAIEPKTKADQDALSNALSRLEEEDPHVQVHIDKDSGQTLISGMVVCIWI